MWQFSKKKIGVSRGQFNHCIFVCISYQLCCGSECAEILQGHVMEANLPCPTCILTSTSLLCVCHVGMFPPFPPPSSGIEIDGTTVEVTLAKPVDKDTLALHRQARRNRSLSQGGMSPIAYLPVADSCGGSYFAPLYGPPSPCGPWVHITTHIVLCTSVWTTIAMWAVSAHTHTHCRLQSFDSPSQQATTPTIHTSSCIETCNSHGTIAPSYHALHTAVSLTTLHTSQAIAMHPSHLLCYILHKWISTWWRLSCSCVLLHERVTGYRPLNLPTCMPLCGFFIVNFEGMGITFWHLEDDPRATPGPAPLAAQAVGLVRDIICHPRPLLTAPRPPSCHPFMTHHEVEVDDLRQVGRIDANSALVWTLHTRTHTHTLQYVVLVLSWRRQIFLTCTFSLPCSVVSMRWTMATTTQTEATPTWLSRGLPRKPVTRCTEEVPSSCWRNCVTRTIGEPPFTPSTQRLVQGKPPSTTTKWVGSITQWIKLGSYWSSANTQYNSKVN